MRKNQCNYDRVMCYHCNKYGHYAHHCPSKRQKTMVQNIVNQEFEQAKQADSQNTMLGKRTNNELLQKIERRLNKNFEENKTENRVVKISGPAVDLRKMCYGM